MPPLWLMQPDSNKNAAIPPFRIRVLHRTATRLAAEPFRNGKDRRNHVRSGNVFHRAVCARGNPNGTARCHAHVVTDAQGNPRNGRLSSNATPGGYGPSDLRSAYNITSSGSGTTVAIVDAYGYTNAESDLAVYRAQYGLPACTTANGCS